MKFLKRIFRSIFGYKVAVIGTKKIIMIQHRFLKGPKIEYVDNNTKLNGYEIHTVILDEASNV